MNRLPCAIRCFRALRVHPPPDQTVWTPDFRRRRKAYSGERSGTGDDSEMRNPSKSVVYFVFATYISWIDQ